MRTAKSTRFPDPATVEAVLPQNPPSLTPETAVVPQASVVPPLGAQASQWLSWASLGVTDSFYGPWYKQAMVTRRTERVYPHSDGVVRYELVQEVQHAWSSNTNNARAAGPDYDPREGPSWRPPEQLFIPTQWCDLQAG